MIVFEPLQPAPRLPVGSGHALQPGERLEDFEITQVLGLTSFGVIYLAQDTAQRETVAIKEFLPVAIAARGSDGHVELRDESQAEAFQRGLDSFISEALTLSRFEHPSLLRVTCVWEGNGTAYRAMPHYVGTSLLARRFSSKNPPGEPELRRMLDGLCGALEVLHEAGYAHGQVEPMNIMALDDGSAMLLDFDAARHAILSDPHAPHVDAYADAARLAAHQVADLQALAAVLHFAISGQWTPLPTGATRRHEPLATVLARSKDGAAQTAYDPDFLAAIDMALSLPEGQQPRNVAEFRALFAEETPTPSGPVDLNLLLEAECDIPSDPIPLDEAPVSTPGELASDEAPTQTALPGMEDAPAPSVAHAQVLAQPRLKRLEPRPIPERPMPEHPLNSSESVLELLAGFNRPKEEPAEGDAEPFQSPVVPTLTEEAEPALPPLRESLFDRIDAGNSLPMGLDVEYQRRELVRQAEWRRWMRIGVWVVALLAITVIALALRPKG